MKIKNIYYVISIVALSLFTIQVVAADTKNEHSHSEDLSAPDKSSAELKQIKMLAGKWRSTTSMFGKENEEVFTEYKVTAGGSAVMETIFPGTPHEMVSVYFDDDNGKLNMTHYCMLRNRPHFKLANSSNNEFKFDLVKIEGPIPKDGPSMGAITLRFNNKDSFSTTCSGSSKNKAEQKPMTMTYTRVKG